MKDYDFWQYRDKIGVVFQDYKFYGASLIESGNEIRCVKRNIHRMAGKMNKIGIFKIVLLGLGLGMMTGSIQSNATTTPTATPSATATTKPSQSPRPSASAAPKNTPTAPPYMEGKEPLPKVSSVYEVDGCKYRVLRVNNEQGTVALVGLTSRRSELTIPDWVLIHGYAFTITEIGEKACDQQNTLKRVTIRGTHITKVGKQAFSGIYKKATIKVPDMQYTKWRGILKSKIPAKATITWKFPMTVSMSDRKYDYKDMVSDLTTLAINYEGVLTLRSLGVSNDGRTIYAVAIGSETAKKKIIVDGCLHGREWLNAQFLMGKIEELAMYYNHKHYKGKTVKQLLKDTCIYIIPMVNPDGVTISQYGLNGIQNPTLRSKLRKINGARNYKRWKANGRGVDLNRNFTKGWGRGAKSPGMQYYPGAYAASEPETKAIISFYNSISGLKKVVHYHCMGEIIYWRSDLGGTLNRAVKKMATKIHKLNRYALIREHGTSSGGFGDWCTKVRRVPGVTVETGRFTCPVPFSELKRVRSKNKWVIENLIS